MRRREKETERERDRRGWLSYFYGRSIWMHYARFSLPESPNKVLPGTLTGPQAPEKERERYAAGSG